MVWIHSTLEYTSVSWVIVVEPSTPTVWCNRNFAAVSCSACPSQTALQHCFWLDAVIPINSAWSSARAPGEMILQLYMKTHEFSWVQTLCDGFSLERSEVRLLVNSIIFCCFPVKTKIAIAITLCLSSFSRNNEYTTLICGGPRPITIYTLIRIL